MAAASISNDPAAGRLVTQQLAEVIQTRGNGVVELALRPEELGRVRMVLAGSESQMTVVIQAERQGTEELIRRHLEQLQQDLQDIGYSSISFAFGDRAPEGDAQVRSAGLGPEIEGDMADEDPLVSAPARYVVGGGMDIRM
ncbi:flagellar hook-length control protein FliK [Shimia sp. CNT1-13L.2]|uniref:flagellar hook-length control protein FliK n=1 Tax=Shimia sp. CNT1-13L.2 TaxID=2959663 RepID=UPI0020CD0A6B|nr:flagellar hook-length control protein FliK [Shimia sp. CNT1-13L.2]MCP9483564.1 flagellar hook-length control protein FliK [Shimia sp. CNT1-13L.2]